jgi:glyoxylase-like metal-dependent hydrolase (beta-lactamase superfamily II)/rhodanese-related sulfurtransferase
MIFQQLFDPVSCTFTYLLARDVGGDALIIDPVFEHVDTYLSLLQRLQLRLAKAVDTHVHADHVTGLGVLRDRTRCVTVMGEQSGADVVSVRLKDGDWLEVKGLRLKAMYTPGHTDDSYSFLMDDRVFTGDTLLIGGTGRTDFQNGDARAAWDSLSRRLLSLPDSILVYPAHDYNGNTVSTIGHERRHNPRLQVKSADAYATLMAGLNLPNPKMMDVAVPANRAIGQTLEQFLRPGDEISAEECRARSASLQLVDLRSDAERRRDGVIPGSIHVPYEELETALAVNGSLHRLYDRHPEQIVLYCAFGERSAMALDAARRHGYTGLRHLRGGLAAWLRAAGEVDPVGTGSSSH